MLRSCLPVLAFGLLASACASTRPAFIAEGPRMPGGDRTEPAPPAPATEPSVTTPAFTDEQWQRIAYVQPWVDTAARQHALSPNLINAVIWVESRFQPRAKSPAGARGLMQLMPATASALAQSLGKHRAAPFDPEFNIAAGSLYLAEMLERYQGDVRLALAAYNAGAGNVDKWTKGDGLPPVSEEYVRLVMDAKRRFDAWERPSLEPAPTHTPSSSATMIAKAQPRQPAREPGPPPEPDDIVPDPPVRYDLDRVESDYVPTIEPEPPLRDTPWPPPEEPKKSREPKVIPEPDDAAPEHEPAKDPLPPDGELPSVLD